MIGTFYLYQMSCVFRKPDFCLCENKGACVFATQIVHTPFLINFKISSFKPTSVTAQTGLCWAWSETRKTYFVMAQIVPFTCRNGRTLSRR